MDPQYDDQLHRKKDLTPEEQAHLEAVTRQMYTDVSPLLRRGAGCLFWPVAFAALFMAWAGIGDLIERWETRELVRTTADVRAVDVHEIQRWSSERGSSIGYRLDVSYRYEVDGVAYDGEGELPALGLESYDRADAEAQVERLTQDSSVTVFYAAGAHARSYLTRPNRGAGWVGIVIGFALLVGARRLRRYARSSPDLAETP